jgi:hypothetical protein
MKRKASDEGLELLQSKVDHLVQICRGALELRREGAQLRQSTLESLTADRDAEVEELRTKVAQLERQSSLVCSRTNALDATQSRVIEAFEVLSGITIRQDNQSFLKGEGKGASGNSVSFAITMEQDAIEFFPEHIETDDVPEFLSSSIAIDRAQAPALLRELIDFLQGVDDQEDN